MSDPDRPRCSEVRDYLLAGAMALDAPRCEGPLAAHLDGCEACRTFAAGLAATRGAFREAAIVDPALRERTLLASARTPSRPRAMSWWLLPPAVVLGLVLSFALPLWLTDQLLRPLLGASPLTVALGLVAVVSQALLAAAALTLAAQLKKPPVAAAAAPGLEV